MPHTLNLIQFHLAILGRGNYPWIVECFPKTSRGLGWRQTHGPCHLQETPTQGPEKTHGFSKRSALHRNGTASESETFIISDSENPRNKKPNAISTATHVMATSECAEDLTRANWNAAFISRIELHILWLGCANCWINWHLDAAKCMVPSGLSHRLCCDKRAVRICVAGCFNCTTGDPSLVAVTLHSHIILQSITDNLSSSTL